MVVSIHAPWEGCDIVRALMPSALEVSIHAPWEGCDSTPRTLLSSSYRFNSRTLGRVRRDKITVKCPTSDVSIHAPWEGCDDKWSTEAERCLKFQFTHPGKGATLAWPAGG